MERIWLYALVDCAGMARSTWPVIAPTRQAKLPIWFDLSAFCQFFTLGRDILIRTILLLSCEAYF